MAASYKFLVVHLKERVCCGEELWVEDNLKKEKMKDLSFTNKICTTNLMILVLHGKEFLHTPRLLTLFKKVF